MMMSKSEAQQPNSPLFLDDEENDLEDTLPFDRCLKADKELEEDLEEKEVRMDKREFLYELPKIKTTPFKSKRDILSWTGTKNVLAWVRDKFLTPVIGIGISAILFIVCCFNPLGLSIELYGGIMAGVLFIFIVAIAHFWSLGEEVSSIEYIYRKLDSEDYLISNRVVDYPSKVKIYLYKDIKNNKELYIRFVPQKQELQFFTNDGKVTYYWIEKSTDKNDFEYQMNYFANQLIPNKFYRISDIITDKAPRNTNKVHK